MAHLDDWPSVRDNQQFAKAVMTAQAATRLRLRLWVITRNALIEQKISALLPKPDMPMGMVAALRSVARS